MLISKVLIMFGPVSQYQHTQLFWAPILVGWGPTPSNFYLLVETGLLLHLFTAYIWWGLPQLLLKKHHKDLKWTRLGFGPIKISLEACLGFLGKTKMKAYTVLPNIYKFPLMGLPENESYSEHGDYHASNFSKKNWIRNFLSEKTKENLKLWNKYVSR